MSESVPQTNLRATRSGQPAIGVKALRYSHEAMIDMIIAEPWINQNELAARFRYTPAWVCTVMACDAFQVQLAARKDELVDPVLRATVEERFRAMVIRSQEVLMEKLSQPASVVPANVALKALELGAKRLGQGGYAAPSHDAGTDRLEALAARLVTLNTSSLKDLRYETAIEVETVEVPQDAEGGRVQGQSPVQDQPTQRTIRADGGSANSSTHSDGGARLDCGQCGKAVCNCTMKDV